MPGRKFNYYKFGAFCLIVLLILSGIIFGISSIISGIKYKKTYDYKFSNLGYSVSEINIMKSNLNEKELNKMLTKKYNEYVDDFAKEKYFLFKNLDKYLEYKKENSKKKNSDIVAIINCEANVEWIDEQKETDISKKELMLVNRLYGLKEDYEPESIVSVPLRYAYSGNKIDGSILEDIIDIIGAGKDAGYTFVVSSGYRSYSEQEKTYKARVNSAGQSEADKYVAMPGHSEYQTGLTFDLQPYNKVFNDEYDNDEYKWLSNNSYKYGFIMRLPKDKEYLTGFNASAWKLRYVGEEVATKIFEEGLTFEEYYAYYVVGEK